MLKLLLMQEAFELAQRKFLRQLAKYSDALDIVYPRLVIVDFLDMLTSSRDADASRQTSSRGDDGLFAKLAIPSVATLL